MKNPFKNNDPFKSAKKAEAKKKAVKQRLNEVINQPPMPPVASPKGGSGKTSLWRKKGQRRK